MIVIDSDPSLGMLRIDDIQEGWRQGRHTQLVNMLRLSTNPFVILMVGISLGF